MRAGRLDRMITIQRKTETKSDSGEPVESWTNVVLRRPATVVAVRGGEDFNNPAYAAKEMKQFWIRRSADVDDVSPLDRIIYPALSAASPTDDPHVRNIYNILAVHEAGRDGFKIVAERRPDEMSS